MDHARVCAAAGRLLSYADELAGSSTYPDRSIAGVLRHEAREVLRGAAPDPGPGQPDPKPSGSGQASGGPTCMASSPFFKIYDSEECRASCGGSAESFASTVTLADAYTGRAAKLALLSWADGEIARLVAELLASDRLLAETAGQLDAIANSLDDLGATLLSHGILAKMHMRLESCIRKIRRLPALYETVQETGKEQGNDETI